MEDLGNCYSGVLSLMYKQMERNPHVCSFRYGKIKMHCRIALILKLKFFTAIFLCRFSCASEYDYGKLVGNVKASGSGYLNSSRRSLDAFLQEYAFRAFVRPQTGIKYAAPVPSNLSGIRLEAVRLRSGSLYHRGIDYNEFQIPAGVLEEPYVERCALVYQNLGNWSGVYYDKLGYDLLGPVLGLLAYDASNLSAFNLPELYLVATKQPVLIRFPKARIGSKPICISYFLNGSVSLSNVSSGYVCSTNYQGHFGLIAKSLAPSPAPMISTSGTAPAPGTNHPHISLAPTVTSSMKNKKKSNTRKIALGSVLGAVVLLILMVYMGFGTLKYRKKAKIAKMENQADQGEALQTSSFGSSRAPAAGGTRTQPMLENDYVA